MAIVRTPKGTAKNKDSTRGLLIPDVSITAPTSIVIGATWLVAGGTAVPKWGPREFGDPMKTVVGNGLRTSIWREFSGIDATYDITLEWRDGSIPTAKAMFATAYTEVGKLDKTASNTFLATTDPGTGALQTTLDFPEVFLGAMGSNGPESDLAGTPQDGYTTGQRDGTVGTPPVSNVTIHEVYKIATGTETTRAKLVGATERAWSCVLATFRALIPKHIPTINGCIDCPWYGLEPAGRNPEPLCTEPTVVETYPAGDRIVPTREYLFSFPTFCPLGDKA